MSQLFGVALRGTGSCLPARVVPNDEFTDTLNLDTSDEWIRTRTGIRERRFADLGETSGSLGTIAARRALETGGIDAAAIDLIVCATATPDLMSPATACLIQAALGCRHIPAFDISAACSGFLYGLSVASQFVRNGAAKNALVVGTEVLSRAIDVLIPHQVNGRIIDAALEATKFPREKVVVNLDKYGNTSAASVPIALDEALRTGRCKSGDTVLLVAFGGGLTWSSAMLTL